MHGPVPLSGRLASSDQQLRLPRLRVELRTAPRCMLNLMALERSSEQRAGDVSYVWLMAKMVRSTEDAGMLAEADVLHGGGAWQRPKREELLGIIRLLGQASDAAAEVDKSYLGVFLEVLPALNRHPFFTKWADVQRYYFTVPCSVCRRVRHCCHNGRRAVLQTFAFFMQKPWNEH